MSAGISETKNVGWALRDQQPDGTIQKSKSVSVSSPLAPTNVGWGLRDQQPDGTAEKSETEIRINNP